MIFSIFDIVILTIIFVSSIMGLYRGMVYITINFLGFIASILVAIFLYSYIERFISPYTASELGGKILSAAISYIISLIFFTFLSTKIMLIFAESSKGIIDRFIGFIVGILRGSVISLVIYSTIVIFISGTYSSAEKPEDIVNNIEVDKYPTWLKESMLTPYLNKAMKESNKYIPDSIWSLIELPQQKQEKKKKDEVDQEDAYESEDKQKSITDIE